MRTFQHRPLPEDLLVPTLWSAAPPSTPHSENAPLPPPYSATTSPCASPPRCHERTATASPTSHTGASAALSPTFISSASPPSPLVRAQKNAPRVPLPDPSRAEQLRASHSSCAVPSTLLHQISCPFSLLLLCSSRDAPLPANDVASRYSLANSTRLQHSDSEVPAHNAQQW